MRTKALPAMRDFFPEDLRVRQWLFGLWREVALAWGYEEYDSCVLESEALYIRKAGDEVTGQLFNFEDKGGRRVALRPEMTPTLARMIMDRQGVLPLPLRWFAIPQCFRYERQQRGRTREHYQWNMDAVGIADAVAEVELIGAQAEFLRRVGLQVDGPEREIEWRLSDRRLLQGFLEGLGIVGERFGQVCVIVDKLDKIGPEATAELLCAPTPGLDLATASRILEVLALDGLTTLVEALGADAPGVAELQALMEMAEAAGCADVIRIDPGVVRGLSYYTGTVWEVFATAGTFRRAIAGGGRYDALIGTLGGKSLPMVGFGLGDVPILTYLEELGRLPRPGRRIDAVVFAVAAGQLSVALRLATALRGRGQQVLVDLSLRRFKHAVQAAEQAGASEMYVIGEKEFANGMVTRRHLGASGRHENTIPLTELGCA